MAKPTDMDKAELQGAAIGLAVGLAGWAAKVAVACLIIKAVLLA